MSEFCGKIPGASEGLDGYWRKQVDRTRIQLNIKRWRVALLALLSIAASQLVLAGHQFAHDETIVAENCAVCLQLEQLDSPPVVAESATLLPYAKLVPPVLADHLVAGGIVRRYSSRAPPSI